MVKLRLQRFGNHKRPYYRVVASDSKTARDGKFLDILGTYDPINGQVNFDKEKIQTWLSNGAQPTDTVRSLLKKHKTLS
jgi:small subunit ribosomal protein S16